MKPLIQFTALVSVVVLLGFSVVTGRDSTTSAKDYCNNSTMAWVMAQRFVTGRLRAPSTAKFPWYSKAFVVKTGSCSYRVRGYVDAQNGFSAMVRSNFSMGLYYDAARKTWHAREIVIQ